MAQLLLQIAHVRARTLSRARPLHPVDEAEKHFALDDGRRPHHPPRFRILRLVCSSFVFVFVGPVFRRALGAAHPVYRDEGRERLARSLPAAGRESAFAGCPILSAVREGWFFPFWSATARRCLSPDANRGGETSKMDWRF